ncbi:MAG TPA: hypothetical protein VLH84_03140 [Patescibacteria group bacterium]|nr:hypothetical protein [Patescibacteria group bacterium]
MNAVSPGQARPSTLYRGVIVPAGAVTGDMLVGDIRPGEEPLIDAEGRKVVADGNEYGVYMSDNGHMAEVAYATPRHTTQITDSPTFRWRGANQERLGLPKAGVLHQVDTTGLDIRKPYIQPQLRGVYNNGFQGDEWIVDTVPAANHHPIKLTLGPDMLHPAQGFDVVTDPAAALEALRAEVAYRSGRFAVAKLVLEGMSPAQRNNDFYVKRAFANLPTEP